MHVRSLGFRTDLMIRRLTGSDVIDVGEHIVVRTASNPEFWWGNFVLIGRSSSLPDGLDRFREAFPGARHVAIGIDGTDGDVPEPAASLGLDPDVSVVLTAEAGALAQPNTADVDVETAELREEAHWAALLDLRTAEAAAEGPSAAAEPAYQLARLAEVRESSERGHAASLGAFVEGRLVAALGIASDGTGLARYQHVYTEPKHRRRGLAGCLIVEAARIARHRWQAGSVVIVADPDGPAIGLYRALGFRTVERQVQLQAARPD